jgi:tetratricopeptide (TPR) repeat protein
MAERDPLVDPEAEAILLEVARDPRSVLLKVERPRKLSSLVARGSDIMVTHKAGLTSAEKELLTTYREEAAYLLRLAYFELTEVAGLAFSRGLFITNQETPPEPLGSDRLASLIRALRPELRKDSRASSWIDRALPAMAKGGTLLSEVAHCSLQLAPSTAGKSYIGEALVLEGRLEEAKHTIESLLQFPASSACKASLHTSLASIQVQLEEDDAGLRSFRTAAQIYPQSAVATYNWFWCALHLGKTDEAKRAARQVDHFWLPSSHSLSSWMLAIREQRSRGLRTFQRLDQTVFRGVQGSVGATSGLIFEEALH